MERKIPSRQTRTEITVVNSRFLTTVMPVKSVDEAKEGLRSIRAEMSDASHHVYAYRIGHGNSVIDGMSDDGEPSGTAGPPTLAVLRGSGLGDILVVVTRYFGGTKLGTGGLVRAYSDAARTGLEATPTELKISRTLVGIEVPYPLFEQIKRMIEAYRGTIVEQEFAADITLLVRFETQFVTAFDRDLLELSAGQVSVLELETTE